jgi:hypothetical protein
MAQMMMGEKRERREKIYNHLRTNTAGAGLERVFGLTGFMSERLAIDSIKFEQNRWGVT